MPVSTDTLDAAFDRLAQWGFDDPNGYVNHGPMTCEALDVLGYPDEVDSWSRLDSGSPPVNPAPPVRFDWADALGDSTRTAEWMGYFERSMADVGWEPVLGEWLPRLLPGMGVALFHGAIRCAHATRAIEAADTPARRAELVRSLGYWAALFEPGQSPDLNATDREDDQHVAIVRTAADAARHYLARPNIINLHGVTGAMAVSILIRHADDATAAAALAQITAENTALFTGGDAANEIVALDIDQTTLVRAAIASGEAHAVKLVEAAQRGYAATGDPVFLAAAERVVRRGLRKLTK